ncbi:MAG: hypothetical protein ACRDHZ_21895 [Ktedonobacteraceae bacterium]
MESHDPKQAFASGLRTTWGENPLLFSLGTVLYLRHGHLSRSRATLYCEVINALLETCEPDVQRHKPLPIAPLIEVLGIAQDQENAEVVAKFLNFNSIIAIAYIAVKAAK